MKILLAFLLCGILFFFCWPLAILLLLAWPFIWLLSLPFRIVAVVIEAVLALFKAVLFLPARLLGPPHPGP
jgi:hypothetical protein